MPDIHWSSSTKRTKVIGLVTVALLIFPLVVNIVFYDAFEPILALFSKQATAPAGFGNKVVSTGTRQMTFSEHDNYMNLSHEYDSLWADLLPPNGGFILNPDRNNAKRKYGISMFHQLHCLGMLREAFQDLTMRLAFAEQSSTHSHAENRGTDSSFKRHDHEDSDHWLHCFDYLRQTILCNADATIEPPTINFQGNGIIDGMISRQCNDWTALYSASINSHEHPDIIARSTS